MKEELLAAAAKIRTLAYAPYSNYPVGAALLDEAGRIHAGCNIENVSFPVGMCAERAAIAHLIGGGGRQIRALGLVTRDGGTPCGMCLQALSEFAIDPAAVTVFIQADSGETNKFTLAQLLPHAFQSETLG